MDEAVKQGIADPNRLGIGGWSYGGISTDYTIASDTRFKAAISGAGSAMQFTMYGVDQYIIQYDQEMGQPWKAKDKWMKVSYPFFNADKIKTPTLFMGGEKDFNVPIAGGEQMYQALKSMGVDTQLVIYPGQFHGLTIPSYERDRLQRYLNWFNKYLQPTRPRRRRHNDETSASSLLTHAFAIALCPERSRMAAQSADMRTRAEITNYEETSTYADVDARHRRPGRDQPARLHRELRQDRRGPRPAADGDLRSEGDDAGDGAQAGPAAGVRAGEHSRRRSRRQGSDPDAGAPAGVRRSQADDQAAGVPDRARLQRRRQREGQRR